ncbi:MAG: RNA polymerase sigma factor [Acidobacteriota bacterium]
MDGATPDLLERFKQGDSGAYRTLAERYDGDLRRYARSRMDASLQAEVTVDDLLQEVHEESLKGIARFEYRRERAFFFWQCGIARNRIRKHCERLKRRPPAPQLSALPREHAVSSAQVLAEWMKAGPSPLKAAARRQDGHLIALAMDQLSDAHREALLLRHVEGLSGPEAAARLGIEPGAFRKRVHDAKLKLAGLLDDLLGEDERRANLDLR